MRKIQDGRCFDEEYSMSNSNSSTSATATATATAKVHAKGSAKETSSSSANSMSEALKLEIPKRVKYHLRLHNDDVHTYDEVIAIVLPITAKNFLKQIQLMEFLM